VSDILKSFRIVLSFNKHKIPHTEFVSYDLSPYHVSQAANNEFN
jgi:hypothetical protein